MTVDFSGLPYTALISSGSRLQADGHPSWRLTAGDWGALFMLLDWSACAFGERPFVDPVWRLGYLGLPAAPEGDSGAMVAAACEALATASIPAPQHAVNHWLVDRLALKLKAMRGRQDLMDRFRAAPPVASTPAGNLVDLMYFAHAATGLPATMSAERRKAYRKAERYMDRARTILRIGRGDIRF